MPELVDLDPGFHPEDLPRLTAKQSAYVSNVLSGMTYADAYRSAYDAKNMGRQTIFNEASRVANHPNVKKWLFAANMARLSDASCTLEDHRRELVRIRELGVANNDLKAAVAAEHLRGKVSGHYIERMEITHRPDPAYILTQIARLDVETAKRLAERFNVDMPETKVIEHQRATREA